VVSILTLAGCSGGGHDKPSSTGSPTTASPTPTPEPASAPAAVATVTGRLSADRRDALADAVTQVVDGWLEGAYLGDFPRTDYSAAFAGFTAGAGAKARRDLALMTNAAISEKIDKAEATKRTISLDVLSIRQRPVGVTATVDLTFETSPSLAGAQVVTGTVELTPVGNRWKIFGFDVSRRRA
jgi:hypothetical protein